MSKYTKEELNLIYSTDVNTRIKAALSGLGLDILVFDGVSTVRESVANVDYGLDILVSDIDWKVRRAVAKRGFGLNRLIDDPDWRVVIEVAKLGFGIPKLINNENNNVRNLAIDMYDRLDRGFRPEYLYLWENLKKMGYVINY